MGVTTQAEMHRNAGRLRNLGTEARLLIYTPQTVLLQENHKQEHRRLLKEGSRAVGLSGLLHQCGLGLSDLVERQKVD